MGVVRVLLASLFTWIVPLGTSFFFFTRDGNPTTPVWVFKGVMILVLAIAAVAAFRWLSAGWSGETTIITYVVVGLVALAVNVGLDSITIVRMQHMDASRYVVEVGVLYLTLIVFSHVVGYASRHGG